MICVRSCRAAASLSATSNITKSLRYHVRISPTDLRSLSLLCVQTHYHQTTSSRASQRRKVTTQSTLSAINPPSSTLPPKLSTPTRGKENIFTYLWNLARSYGSFYKTGVWAILANRRSANEVIARLQKETGYRSSIDYGYQALLHDAVSKQLVTRSEYQLLKRHAHDIRRVPVFAVLVLLVGEWLPLFVPLFPYLPPLTCRIPSQTASMRKKAEDRRRWSFRAGLKGPSLDEVLTTTNARSWPLMDQAYLRRLIGTLSNEQLFHLSCVLNLHSRMWETMQLGPPSFLLRSRVASRLQYLTEDDVLLSKGKASSLADDEVAIACEERGIDVVGPPREQLQAILVQWLQAQRDDDGKGVALMNMLFKRFVQLCDSPYMTDKSQTQFLDTTSGMNISCTC